MSKTQKDIILSKEDYNNMDINSKIIEIEKICKNITYSPEQFINHINTLFLGIKDLNNPKISKICILSIAEIYKQITPLYSIDVKKNNEKLKQIITKEERKLITFENNLVSYFDKYINLIYDIKQNLKNNKNINHIESNDIKNYEIIIIKAFSELFNNIYHFNNIDLVFRYLLKKIFNLNAAIKPIIENFVENLIKNQMPSILEYKLKLFIYIAKMIKDQKFLNKLNKSILEKLINIEIKIDFERIVEGLKKMKSKNEENYIDIKVVNRLEDLENKESKIQISTDKELIKLRDLKKRGKISKKQEKTLMQKEKEHTSKIKNLKNKDNKILQKKVKKEIELASAEIDKKTLTRQYLELLNKYYYIIFKILKQGYKSESFDIALNGLLKYAVIINYKFLNDIYSELKETINFLINDLKNINITKNEIIAKKMIRSIFRKLLSIIYSLREIKTNTENLLEIEDNLTYKNFYKILFEIENNIFYLKCIQKNEKAMILKFFEKYLIDNKPFENQVIATYCKSIFDISHLSLKEDNEFSYCCLLLCKILLQKYSVINRLVEKNNEGFGLNKYYSDLDNPYIKNSLYYNLNDDIKKYQNDIINTVKIDKQKFNFLLNKIINKENLEVKYFKKKPSDIFIELMNK